jgi:drug/metabolite transporter (DMT)-like permease
VLELGAVTSTADAQQTPSKPATNASAPPAVPASGVDADALARASLPWHAMPSLGARGWAMVSVGVLLVTVLAVALGNFALFRTTLGLWLTLQSLGPIYALPIAFAVKREVASMRAWAGSAVAVLGVAIFCRETLALAGSVR